MIHYSNCYKPKKEFYPDSLFWSRAHNKNKKVVYTPYGSYYKKARAEKPI